MAMIRVGIDEVGRGPLAGPVLAAAVHLPRPIEGLADSKQISARRREQLALTIRREARWAIGAASVAEIDRFNILAASHLAMRRALARLGLVPDLVLVDGRLDPGLGCATRCIVGGDATIAEISAASIIAKVARDHLMDRLAARHPAYGFEHHAGYPTARHRAALASFGPCPHHRRSFGPVRAAMAATQSPSIACQNASRAMKLSAESLG